MPACTSLPSCDSRDTAFNPTRGFAAAVDYMKSDSSLGADRDWEKAEIGVGMAVPLRRDVLWMTVAGGSDLDSDLPGDRMFSVGGPDSFPGFEQGELRVRRILARQHQLPVESEGPAPDPESFALHGHSA